MDDVLNRDTHAMWSVIRAFRLVFYTRLHSALTDGEINLPQYNIMALLEEFPEANMSFLAERLNVTMGAVTNLIDRLVKMGYVRRQRDPNDRRLVKGQLTRSGQEVLTEGVRNVVQTLAPAFAGIEPDERKRFLDTADRLIRRIERLPKTPSGVSADKRAASE